MRISTRLTLAVFVPIVVALVVGSTLLYSYRSVEIARTNGDIVRQIRSSITELNHLVFSYVAYREERPKQQFLAEHDSIIRLIAEHTLSEPGAAASFERHSPGQSINKRLVSQACL